MPTIGNMINETLKAINEMRAGTHLSLVTDERSDVCTPFRSIPLTDSVHVLDFQSGEVEVKWEDSEEWEEWEGLVTAAAASGLRSGRPTSARRKTPCTRPYLKRSPMLIATIIVHS